MDLFEKAMFTILIFFSTAGLVIALTLPWWGFFILHNMLDEIWKKLEIGVASRDESNKDADAE